MILAMFAMMAAAQPVTIRCDLQTMDKDPPMFITLNDSSSTVQVTMAGQTYLQDTVKDGTLVFWQTKDSGGGPIVSRLNRADGTLIITNNGQMVKGSCEVAKERF